jgi:DNA-binding MarR family transcriptional regulator
MDIRMTGDIFDVLYASRRLPYMVPQLPPRFKRGQLGVLNSLYNAREKGEAVRVTDICKQLKASAPNTIKLINDMEKMGLLKKTCDTADHRVVFVDFTDEGREIFEKTLLDFYARVSEKFAQYSDYKWKNMMDMTLIAHDIIDQTSQEMNRKFEL